MLVENAIAGWRGVHNIIANACQIWLRDAKHYEIPNSTTGHANPRSLTRRFQNISKFATNQDFE